MIRDPEGDPEAAHPTDRDPEATQAYTPFFDDRDPTSPTPEPPVDDPELSAESLLPFVPSGPEEPTPTRPEEPTALDLLFAGERFQEVTDEPSPVASVLRRTPSAPRPPHEADSARAGSAPRILLVVAGCLFVVLVLVGLFALGTRLPTLFGSAPASQVTDAPPPAAIPSTGPVAPGVWAWNELLGGECLEPFVDAWAQDVTVVDCAEPHAAQLTFRGSYRPVAEDGEPDPSLPTFPGEAELAAGVDALCAGGTIDLAAARGITDGQMQGSFPVTAEQWATDPSYSCFFSRASGAALTGSVAPGTAAD